MGLRHLFTALLCATGIPAHAEWREASSKHFVIYSELPADKLKAFADKLERFDAAIRLLGGYKDDPVGLANRVTVFMVDDVREVNKLSSDPEVAGFYIARMSGAIAVVPRNAGDSEFAQAVLLHEYAHHMMRSLRPHDVYPTWYIEGWAETFATVDFRADGSVDVGRPPQYRGYGLLNGNALPVEKMLVADTLKLTSDQREGLYGRGWLLSHYLTLSGKRQGQLNGYLQGVNQGKPALEAAKIFGDLNELDRELERYKMSRFAGVKVRADRLKSGPIQMRVLTPGEAATMRVRVRSKVGVTEETAPPTYEQAKQAAAAFPEDRGAQLALAEAAFDAGDYVGAEAAADRAIKADAKAVRAYTYKAEARMALALKADDRSPETWKAIRMVIASANRADPDDPVPLVLYYRSFSQTGAAPSATARAGLERAFELNPQDSGLRFNLATMFLRDGNPKTARALMAPLAYQPHGKGFAKAASEMIALLDKGDNDAALRQLDTRKDDADDQPEEPAG